MCPVGNCKRYWKVKQVEMEVEMKKKNTHCEEMGWKGIAGKLQVREQETQCKIDKAKTQVGCV